MTKFLWVEDFPGDASPKVTVSNVFEFANDSVSHLGEVTREYVKPLEEIGIFLQLDFASALKFISNPGKLALVDFIVLDIDLDVYNDFDGDCDVISPILRDWYKYVGGDSDSNSFDEELFKEKCNELKKVAGYHLWAMLVIDLAFPKDRILFCSNHGTYLESIRNSFGLAKLKAPEIFEKSNEGVRAWVVGKQANKYVALRRAVIEACDALKEGMEKGEFLFQMGSFPGVDSDRLNNSTARELLELLPKLMPFDVDVNSMQRNLRISVISLVHLWEAIDPLKLKGTEFEVFKPFVSVMKQARNSTSHSNEALKDISEKNVAFLFLVNFRAMFNFGKKTKNFEIPLLKIIGDDCILNKKLDLTEMFNRMKMIHDAIRERGQLKDHPKGNIFGRDLRKVVEDKVPGIEEETSALLYQLFWHELHPWKKTTVSYGNDDFLLQFQNALLRVDS